MFSCLLLTGAAEGVADAPAALLAVAEAFSPRLERFAGPELPGHHRRGPLTGRGPGSHAVICDLQGVSRLFGDARLVGSELQRQAADRGLHVRVAIAGTRTATRLLVLAHPGLTVVEPGREAQALAPLSLDLLGAFLDAPGPEAQGASSDRRYTPARFYRTSPMQEVVRHAAGRVSGASILEILRRWGLRTLGDLTALPAVQLSERLGQEGLIWQRLARGEDFAPLVPLVPDERFEATQELEWPIEGLEPLSFVLSRLLDPVCAHLERRGRAGTALCISLRLVSREMHVRRLDLPAPMRDAKVLRTLALLDLEAHPPVAGIDVVTVSVEPTPGRVLQYSLLEQARPAPEQLSTLLARLGALMGSSRCGSPQIVDSHRPGAFAMAPFAVEPVARPPHVTPAATTMPAGSGLRRYRRPVPARVVVENGSPIRVMLDRRGMPGGRVEACAGPWRTSGEWWLSGCWDRDEWDVALDHGAIYRLFRDRRRDCWFVEAVVD
jgi:protein ImuB